MQDKKIRWGIAGLGNIARRFADDLVNHVPNSTLHAVASRNIGQANTFAHQFSCAKYYGSYIELARDPEVDVVYVATIHPFHKQLALLFLQHGKHVLVEKPAFTNHQDCCEVAAFAQEKGLLLIEAMKTVVFPAYRKLLHFLQENPIELTSIEAAFGSCNEVNVNPRLFAKTLSGGATLDVGVYPLWLYCDILRAMQCKVGTPEVKMSMDKYQLGVDEWVEFHFDSPISAKLGAAITADLPRHAKLSGVDLEITIHDKWWNPQHIDISWQGKRYDIHEPIVGGGFQFEIAHVADLLLNGRQSSLMISSEVSAMVIKIMEKALRDNQLAHLV